jgi:Asp-tRNA(Asn)/Glu-tRNA(Gln) amidotransferase A subunit family amidase
MTVDSTGMTALAMSDGLLAGRWTAVDLVNNSLKTETATRSGINAFVDVDADEALAEAQASDERRKRGRQLSRLDGVPVAVKDAIAVRGHSMIAGSRTTRLQVQDDAAIVRQMRRAGAVILGRTRLHELAYGATGLNDFDGGARNPSYRDRLTGGSSSGSAAAVAAGICPIAIGTDTGGSIRVPATFCGLVGFKPTYGLLSTEGVLPLSPTLDHVGFLARTVADVRLAMESLAAAKPYTTRATRASTPRVGVLRDPQMPTDESIAEAFEAAMRMLSARGWQLETVSLPGGYDVMELSTTIMSIEAYRSNRERLEREGDRLGADVRERLESGKSISDATYADAMERRRRFREAMSEMAGAYDAFASPAVPIPAPAREDGARPEVRRRLVQNTRLQNLLGMPAITFPGPGDPEPWAIQLSALWDRDEALLTLATSAADILGDGRG